MKMKNLQVSPLYMYKKGESNPDELYKGYFFNGDDYSHGLSGYISLRK
ncbi:hypothetical protein GCM10008986_00690 [Salinibacillus aidingensis]|uniref:Uncharacterized protein n=1 Tax=Salinibacillus aidingensis TaxID=237684 RepID=A0ABN1AME3_9BACI